MLNAAVLEPNEVERTETKIAGFATPLSIPVEARQRIETERQIQRLEPLSSAWLLESSVLSLPRGDLDALLPEHRQAIARCLIAYMDSQSMGEQERLTSETYVLNPFSGEWIKGLEIACAQLGLKAFTGTAPRTHDVFLGAGTKVLRKKYIIHRLSFVRAVFKLLGVREVTPFRGMSSEWQVHQERFFSSWTFSRAVAEAFATENMRAKQSYLVMKTFPIEKLLLTYVETAAMNKQYEEKEAVIIHDPSDELLW